MNLKKNHSERTEEIQSIIDRMPTSFGVLVSTIVFFLFILMIYFGFKIKYPDIVTGQLTINTNFSPIKLVASTNGKLRINHLSSLDSVEENQIIAYIDNPASLENVLLIDSLLRGFNPSALNSISIINQFPSNLSMGELNSKYYTFVNSLHTLRNYNHDLTFDKQEASLNKLMVEQQKAIITSESKAKLSLKTLHYIRKSHSRDSILKSKLVLSEADLDKAEINSLSSEYSYQNSLNDLIINRQQYEQTKSKLQDLVSQKHEKNKELQLAVVSSYNELNDNLKSWKQKYLFHAPFKGRVQFLKFWTDNQFVQAGESVFTIVPLEDQAIGQLLLPVRGAGKVKVGQEVIVKLDDYPYLEYGSVKGLIKSISLTTNAIATTDGNLEMYLVSVDLPNQLKTNYGASLNFKSEAKGVAEIVTADRKLIERLFDNIKYKLKG